jgi:hypothetical protein
MNADTWGSLTERVLGAIFEVSNTLVPDSSRKSTNVLCSQNSDFAASGPLPRFHLQ